MDILNWLKEYESVISIFVTFTLVIITGLYVYLTKKILNVSINQSKLIYNPVIGIHLGYMGITKVFGPSRRNLNIDLNLTNVGNAPAIDILIDAEIILQYSNIKGEKEIPARFDPFSIPFIRPNEVLKDNPSFTPNFGNKCISHLLEDFRECHRLNLLRLETNSKREAYNASRLKIYIYYRNNVDQYFESTYETYLHLGEPMEFKIPKDDETSELRQIYIPRPKYQAGPITKEKMQNDITKRNIKRKLSGW